MTTWFNKVVSTGDKGINHVVMMYNRYQSLGKDIEILMITYKKF